MKTAWENELDIESPRRRKIEAWFSPEKIGNTGLRRLLSMKNSQRPIENFIF